MDNTVFCNSEKQENQRPESCHLLNEDNQGGDKKDESEVTEISKQLEGDNYQETNHSGGEEDNCQDIKTIESLINSSGKCVDIFNPFKRRTKIMKFDHRRESREPKSRNTVRQAADYRKTYLFVYNLMMFIGFLFVFLVLIIKVLSRTLADDTIEATCSIVKLLTFIQFIESIHPLLGLVPGGVFMPFAQASGRFVVVLFLGEPEIRHNSEPFVLYLILVWSAIEIVRYPFYALRVFRVNIEPLTWLRYSLFLPLYPLGGFCETMVVSQSLQFYDRTGEYSISMPNRFNVSFHLPTALRIYLGIILYPTIYVLMRYMWSQRKKQLALKEKQE